MQDITYNMMRLMLFEHNAPQATVAPWLCWIADPTFSSVVVPFCLCGLLVLWYVKQGLEEDRKTRVIIILSLVRRPSLRYQKTRYLWCWSDDPAKPRMD